MFKGTRISDEIHFNFASNETWKPELKTKTKKNITNMVT